MSAPQILWRHTDKHGDRITAIVPPAGGITVLVDRVGYGAPGAVWLSREEAAALASALINGRGDSDASA